MIFPKTIKKPPKPRYLKPEAVKELERLADAEARIKHPTCPHLAPRRFRDDSSNGLTDCIVKYITLKGGFASRINSTGIFDKRLNKYRRGTQKKGIADVLATYRSKSLHIEVKHGKDRVSDAQMKVQTEVTRSGGLYFIAHNFTDFKLWFDNVHFAPLTDKRHE